MNPLPFILLAISLPLLLGGCGGDKNEPVAESVADTKPKLEGVNYKELEIRGNIFNEIAYHKGSPYTGKSFELYDNGQKSSEENWKDGKRHGLNLGWHENGQKDGEANYKDGMTDGLEVWWHENGQKSGELNFKDGELISEKWWNSKGERVDSYKEAIAE